MFFSENFKKGDFLFIPWELLKYPDTFLSGTV